MRDLTRNEIMRSYRRMRYEYDRMTEASCPPKVCVDLSKDEGPAWRTYGNAMSASLTTGHWGGKFIRVDEETGEMQSRTVVFDKNGSLAANVDSEWLTRWRCAMMAALALEKFFGDQACHKTVGLIGTGKINEVTFKVLQEVLRVDPESVLIKGSPRNPLKNSKNFSGAHIVLDTKDMFWVDAVIECVTITENKEVLEVANFERDGETPSLFVAQDSGWLYGSSFRDIAGFTDHVGQIAKSDMAYEWPWDHKRPAIIGDMRSPHFSINTFNRACVYLTGIAISDVVIALETCREAD